MKIDDTVSISIQDREVLKILFESEDTMVNLYDVHLKYRISPAQLARFVNRYETLGLIECRGTRIKLAIYGEKWLSRNRFKVFGKVENQWWKNTPEEMQISWEEMQDVYIPKRMHMGNEFRKTFHRE